MRSQSMAVFALLCCLTAATASASTVRFLTDAELIARSERVVHGRVVGQRASRGGPQGQTIYTVTTLAIVEDLSGVAGDTVEVWELGGTDGNESMSVGGAVQFRSGEEVVVCLQRGSMGLHTIGMGMAKFDVQEDGAGARQLVRSLGDLLVVGGAAPSSQRSLEAFRDLAIQVTGRTPQAGRILEMLVPIPVDEPFTQNRRRWIEADSGTPIRYYVNSSATSPLGATSPTASVQTALAAWTNPPAASVILQYVGTTFQPISGGPWNGTIPAKSVVITFEDPDDEIDDPVLAITFSYASTGTGGTIRGTTFDGYLRAAIKFQNAADLSSSYRQATNFTRVLTHEVGHSIGLGHTQTDGTVVNPTANIMYPSCCSTDTPVAPALGPDDIDGVAYLYPTTTAACQYFVTPASASKPSGGGSGSVTLTTYASCGWTAVSNSAFIMITSAAGGAGSSVVSYTVAPNPGSTVRSGTITVAGRVVTITQSPNLPVVTLDRPSLSFGVVTSGAAFAAQTPAQTVRLTQTGPGAVSWTATASQSWLQVTPAAGVGSATLQVSVRPTGALPAAGSVIGSIALTYSGASTSSAVISVTLRLMPNGTSAAPFGAVDTPVVNATGITGAVPFTGWALDDVEVAALSLCRSAVVGETVVADGRCGGAAQVYLADAQFIDGARPDVQVAYPSYPRSSRAGWGVLVLTNMLPNQGNGTYTVWTYARDREGRSTLLSSRTITCNNASATRPFGTIDTPVLGEEVSGSAYVNFGWVLTQNPKFIPVDGSTIMVYVDGAAVGHPSYNYYRADIAASFPGLANSNGAIGFRVLDTTVLSNGLHTISWAVTDSAGFSEGIGSRYFLVANGAALTAADVGGTDLSAAEAAAGDAMARDAAAIDAVPPATTGIVGRHGWDPDSPWRTYAAGAGAGTVVRGEELDRIELQVGDGAGDALAGYLRVGPDLAPLPLGSRLDTRSGLFTWSPGVGFVGTYDLVFVDGAGGRAAVRREVRIILAAKGTGRVGPQVTIDAPLANRVVSGPFMLGGWAADLDAPDGTGIDTLHVWAYPVAGGSPIFLGTALGGGDRPDVAAVHGEQFREAGYGLVVQGLAPGAYDIAVFAWSNVTGGFVPATVVRVAVR